MKQTYCCLEFLIGAGLRRGVFRQFDKSFDSQSTSLRITWSLGRIQRIRNCLRVLGSQHMAVVLVMCIILSLTCMFCILLPEHIVIPNIVKRSYSQKETSEEMYSEKQLTNACKTCCHVCHFTSFSIWKRVHSTLVMVMCSLWLNTLSDTFEFIWTVDEV